MKRVEIILSAAIEEDFITKCEELSLSAYTKLVDVLGRGNSVPKQGDDVWPQFNSLFILYCEEEKIEVIKNLVGELRMQYPSEGFSCFISENDFIEI